MDDMPEVDSIHAVTVDDQDGSRQVSLATFNHAHDTIEAPITLALSKVTVT